MEYWIALGWIVCGFLAYGLNLANFQRGWPTLADKDRDTDRRGAFYVALSGPIGLTVGLFTCRHGFMWRLPPRKDG